MSINRSCAACAVFVLSLLCCQSLEAAEQQAKPNIIFVMADDLGYGDVGFNGQQHIRTPNLDKMAEGGMVFTSHYAGSTVCMPSRCALLTGKHMGHATVRSNSRWTFIGKPVNLGPNDVTVAQELKRAGYQTAIIGKWGLAEGGDDAGMPSRQGFDYFYGYRTHGGAHHYYPKQLWRNDEAFDIPGNDTQNTTGTYAHDMVTDEALKWVDANSGGPFFLYLAFTIPHYELTVPDDSKEPYKNLGWPKKPMKKGHYRHDAEGNVAYAGMVSRMDRDMGRLIALLEKKGIAGHTLVIFTSDNGPEYEKRDRFFNSNGPYRGGKRDLYEGGIRVPFVAYWPGTVEAGAKTDHPSAFWDLLPTACELAGVKPTEKGIDGISYAPTLLGRASQMQHDYLYWEFNERAGPMQAIRAGKWKAVKLHNKPLQLYDLSTDPGENNNIAAQHPGIVERMQGLLKTARTENPAFKLEPNKAAMNRKKK